MVKTKSILFISLYLLLLNTALQALGQSEEDLHGTWKLERISVIEGNEQRTISVDSLGFEIPSEIEVNQEEITLVRPSSTDKAKYNAIIKGSLFCFPICARWEVVEEKLRLEWGQDIVYSSGDSKIHTVILNYSRK